jgi:hypothetical protein
MVLVAAGSGCAAVAAIKRRPAAVWFAVGASAAVAGYLVGGGLLGSGPQIALTVAPVAVATAMPAAPRVHGMSRQERSIRNWILLRLFVANGLLLVVGGTLVGGLGAMARDGSTAATIVSRRDITIQSKARGAMFGRDGLSIDYTFSVGGTIYRGTARRSWSDEQATTAKVCYDPENPAGSHVLAEAGAGCGGFELWPQSDR